MSLFLIFAAAVSAPLSSPAPDVAACVVDVWKHAGRTEVVTTEYGQRVDFRFMDLFKTAADANVSLEIRADTVVLYGHGRWEGQTSGMWKRLKSKCNL